MKLATRTNRGCEWLRERGRDEKGVQAHNRSDSHRTTPDSAVIRSVAAEAKRRHPNFRIVGVPAECCDECLVVELTLGTEFVVIRVYDEAGKVIETHEHKGEFKES